MSDIADPVVVGVDGSACGTAALRWAVDEAAWRRRPLRVVHAVGSADPQSYGPGQTLVDAAVARARTWQPGLAVTGFVYGGRPTAELCTESEHAELVVVGSRGHGDIAGLLLGSVSAQVAAHARCPVLVVRDGQPSAGPAAAPASAPASGRPVLVGVDGSAAADLAAGWAFEEAAARDVGLMAVRVWQPPHAPWRIDVRPLILDVDELETAERRLLRESIAGWRAKYPTVPVRLRLMPGGAGAALVTASQDAQLAVVGSRGHGGFAGLLLGSASQQLLHHAGCPVLITRERGASAE